MAKLLLLIGTILTTMSFVPYIRDIIHHGVRPRMVSWVIWSVLLGLMTVVGLQEKQWGSVLVSGVSTIGCLVIVLLGWRYASRGITRFEKATLLAAVLGIIAWFVVGNPLVVMAIALAVDALAYVPTFIHGWQQPEEESVTAYVVGFVGEVIIIGASWLMHASALGYAYPVYAVIFGLIMISSVLISRWWNSVDGGFVAETY